MKLPGVGPFWGSVALHVSVLGALAFWKLAPPPANALPDIWSGGGGGGQEIAGEQTIHIVRPAPKIVRQPKINQAVAERRLVAAKPSEILLPAPEPVVIQPEPVPQAPVAVSVMRAAKKESGGGAGKKSAGGGSTLGKGRGDGIGDRKASYRHQADLVYPSSARRQHQKGVVKVKVYVNSQGRAEQAEVTGSSGFNALDEAALNCARSSSYLPALHAGSPISTWVDASFRFQ